MRKEIFKYLIYLLFFCDIITAGSQKDLPLSHRIKIMEVKVHKKSLKDLFVIDLDKVTYQNMVKSLIIKIKEGYKPDCNLEFDNIYLNDLEKCPDALGSNRYDTLEIRFETPGESPSVPHLEIQFTCEVILSHNKKYAGLIFKQEINTQLIAHHFVLINSKGEIQWEMPYEVKESIVNAYMEIIELPHDGMKNSYCCCQVSNDGKLVYLRGDFICGELGWILYDSRGKIIKESSNQSLYPVFSSDGKILLVQESNNLETESINYDSGTSCYQTDSGKLLWRKDDLLPLRDTGYLFSPNSQKVLVCRRDGYCIIDRSGNLLSSLSGLEDCDCNDFSDYRSVSWGLEEEFLIHNRPGGYIRWKNFEIVKTFKEIEHSNIEKYGRLEIHKIYPCSADRNFFVGYREPGFGKWYESKYQYRVFGFLDRNFLIVGLKHIYTTYHSTPPIEMERIGDQNFAIRTSNEEIILNVTGKEMNKSEITLPVTPTPLKKPASTPTNVPRPTKTPNPPGNPEGISYSGPKISFCSNIYYGESDYAEILLIDPMKNQDSSKIEEVSIIITSDSDPSGIQFLLKENSVGSHYFLGNLHFSRVESKRNQKIKVSHRDTISAIFIDSKSGKKHVCKAQYYDIRYNPPISEME